MPGLMKRMVVRAKGKERPRTAFTMCGTMVGPRSHRDQICTVLHTAVVVGDGSIQSCRDEGKYNMVKHAALFSLPLSAITQFTKIPRHARRAETTFAHAHSQRRIQILDSNAMAEQ